ncbi:hypothetical protein BBJ28_00003119 [Nothophytophthora sp. Chile5]|nr:hypothetical protein BBJ28_00003119 [Nothophytophthora sp. Chile5]
MYARVSPPASPSLGKPDVPRDETSKGHGLREPPQQALGRVGAVVMETLQQRATVHSVRSLFSCLGLGEAAPFNLPPQHRMLARMKTNGNYFFTNYLLMTGVVFAFLLLFFHRIQLLVCIAVAYGWYVFLTKKRLETDQLVVFGRRLSDQDVLLLATACTSLGSAVHALLRNTRLKDDSSNGRQGSEAASEVDALV